jgi:hypothetical protein
MPAAFWAEALANTTYIRNRIPTSSNPFNLSPHEIWFGRPPSLHHVRQFGCIAYAHIPHEKTKKLDPRSKQCCLLGSVSASIYRLFDPDSNRIFTFRDVIFKENTFLPIYSFNIPDLQGKFYVNGINEITDINELPTPTIPQPPAYRPSSPQINNSTASTPQHPFYPIPPPPHPRSTDDSDDDEELQITSPTNTVTPSVTTPTTLSYFPNS